MKGGRSHLHPMDDRLLALSETESGYLFPGRHGYGHINPSSLSDLAREWAKAVGVRDARLHDWRSAFFSWGESEGRSDNVLHAVLSHSKKDLTRVYGLHRYREEKKEAIWAWITHLEDLQR